jgi:hypothetical protein
MKSADFALITSGDMTGTITSKAIDMRQIYGYAVQGIFTGTPLGSIKLQASCDSPPTNEVGGPAPTNWSDIQESSQSISGAGNWLPNVIGSFYNWVRVVYTPTTPGSNAGTLNVRMNAKG